MLFNQGIGFIALLFVVLSFQRNSRSYTLVYLFIASFLFGLHFFLLGAYAGAALNMIGALRALLFYGRDSKKWLDHMIIMWILIGLFALSGFYTFREPADVLPVVAMIIESAALWNRNTRIIRYLFLSARPMWLTYNSINGSIAGIVSEVFLIISLLVAVYRFDLQEKIKTPRSLHALRRKKI